MKYRFVTGLFILWFCLNAQVAFGQDIQCYAEVDRNQIAVGDLFHLTLTVEGTQSVNPVDIEDIDGFNVRYTGPSTRVSIVNGHSSVSKSFIYTLLALKEGTFEIPSFSVEISGKTYDTEPITVKVGAKGSSSPVQEQQPQQNSIDISNKAFVFLQTSKKEVYLNEKIPVYIRLFVTGLSLRDIEFPQMESTGFSMDDVEQPKQYQQVIKGIRFNIVEFQTAVYPKQTGNLVLGPASINGNIIQANKQRRRSPFGGFDDFFDNDFMGFFDRYEKYPIRLQSKPINIRVKPWMDEGKPKDFTGAIGRFDFKATLSPQEVTVGDPLTLRMQIKGDNLKSVTMPSLPKLSNFKLYDPEIKEEEGAKVLEQVVIPKSVSIEEIPEIRFSYFDPDDQKYKTMTQGPFKIKVLKPKEGEGFKIVGLDNNNLSLKEELGRDIVFIKDSPGQFVPVNNRLYKKIYFVLLIVGTVLLWIIAVGVYYRTRKIKTDISYARRLVAPKKAKKGLKQAQTFMAKDDRAIFYDTLFRTLQEYLGDKLHLSSGSITFATIEGVLDKEKTKEVLNEIKLVFEECDMARYAAAALTSDRMRTNFQRVEKIIDYLERN